MILMKKWFSKFMNKLKPTILEFKVCSSIRESSSMTLIKLKSKLIGKKVYIPIQNEILVIYKFIFYSNSVKDSDY